MKHIFKITTYSLFIALTIGTTDAFGMEWIRSMPVICSVLQHFGIVRPSHEIEEHKTQETTPPEAPLEEVKMIENPSVDHQRYQLLYNLLTTMPPELILIIVGYVHELGDSSKTMPGASDNLFEVAPGIIVNDRSYWDKLKFWNIDTGKLIKVIKTNYQIEAIINNNILELSYANDRTTRTTQLFNWKSEKVLSQEEYKINDDKPIGLIQVNDQQFITFDHGGWSTIYVWLKQNNVLTKDNVIWFGGSNPGDTIEEAIALSDNHIAVALRWGAVDIHNIQTNQRTGRLFAHQLQPGAEGHFSLIKRPADVLVIARTGRKTISFWNWKTSELLTVINTNAEMTSTLKFSDDYNAYIVGLNDGTIELHNPETKTYKNFRAYEEKPVTKILLLSKKRIATSRDYLPDNEIKIWE